MDQTGKTTSLYNPTVVFSFSVGLPGGSAPSTGVPCNVWQRLLGVEHRRTLRRGPVWFPAGPSVAFFPVWGRSSIRPDATRLGLPDCRETARGGAGVNVGIYSSPMECMQNHHNWDLCQES